jgi:hypothetical protein
VDIQPPEESNRLGRATFGLEFYQHQVDSSLDTLVPLATPQNGLLYLNPKLSVSDRLNPSVSVGLGYRHLFEGPQIILGGNLFYDSDYTNFDHHVNQFGFGAEVLSRWVDFRANYYLPEQNRRRINTKQTTSLSQKVTSSTQALGPVATSDTIGFSGHNLVETIHGMNQTLNTFNVTNYQTTHFWEQYEGAMRGVDTELGFLIPGLDKYAETRIFGGYYYYENPFGKNFSGFKGRLEVRALPSVTFDAAYYQDKEIVGSNWYYGVRVSTPFDVGNIAHGKNPFAGFAEGFKPQQTSDAERFAARLSENVIRSSHVATSHSNFIEVGQKTVVVDPPATFVTGTPFTKTIVLTLDGTPITITHVDSAVAVAGDGSVEHPYMTLTLADTDAVKRAIVLLHAGSTFNSQSITLAPNQMLLGSSTGVTNTVKTDQLGVIKLPNAGNGAAMPTITNPGGTIVNVATNNVIAGLTLTNAARGVAAPSGTTNLVVRNSTISNMTIAGLGLNAAPVTGTTVSNVTFTGNNQDIVINGSNTTIANTTSTGAMHGSIDLVNPSGTTALSNVVINGASDFAVRSTNAAAGSTHNFAGFKATGGAAGIDIEGGAGTFNVDSASTLTNTGGASLLVNGGSANVNFGGNITQAMNAPAVAVLGGHTGTLQFSGGTVAASAGPGLQFNNANGTYQFLGTTKLTGGANLQILNNSAGTFAFSTGASIVNGSGQDILVDNSTASLQYSGSASTNSGALLQVNNHLTGTLQFDTGTLSATGGTGLQFNNADGTYKFLGTATLTGTSAGVALTNGSDGTFQFDTATNITNPTGTAFFVNGGTANITYSGNITANTGFALQVLNHSTGTINFNTGKINQTAGIGVQFVNDAGTYNLADTRVSNSSGTAVQVTGSPTGTFNFGTVKLVDSAGTAVLLTNGGTVNLLGGTIDGAGGNGILSVNTTLTATGLTLGGNHSKTIAGSGVQVINSDGTARTVTISNDGIRSNGPGIQSNDGGTAKELTLVLDGNTIETLAGGAPAIDLIGSGLNSTIVKSMNGGTVTGNGAGGGLSFNRVTFDASGAALSGTAVNAGTWNIGQGTGANQRVLNDGLYLSAPTGTLNFGTLNIFNNAGTGLFVDTKTLGTTFTLSGGGSGTIDTLGGAAVNIDPLTTNLTFGSVTSTNSSGAGVIVSGLTSGSTLTFGSTHVVNSAGSGVVVLNSNGANINFGTTTVNNAGGSGIDLSGAGGANVTFGTTTVVNPGASGINMSGATGTFIFGDTTINGTAAGQTAFNLNGGNANVTANSLNINGGGIGIDLRNTINGHTVIITNGGNVHNVNVAVQLGGGVTGNYANSANAFFTFDVTGGHNSTISGNVAIEARGLVSTASNIQGTYDFRNVTNIVGAENFEPTAGTPFFVAASAHGTGDGSTPQNAAVYTAIAGTPAGTFIVLVNDGNVINIGASTITLQNNDHVDTFGNGRTFSAGTAPINILLPGVAQFTDPFGNGAATITGTGALFVAANGDLLQNFTMTLGGVGSTGISATGSNGLTVTSLTINGTGSVFNLTNTTGSVNLVNNNINVSGGTLLSVNGGNATVSLTAGTGSITNTGGAGVNIANTTGGNVTITGVNVTGATSTPLVFDNNKATFNITNSTFAVNAGVTLLKVDTTLGGSTSTLTFNNSNTLSQSSGTIAVIGAGARNIDLSALNFNNDGTTAANVISVTGQTGGTISFGNVNIDNYNNLAGTAVSLAGTGGTVSFGHLRANTTNGAGVSVGAITFAPGSTSTIGTNNGTGLVMNGTTLSGGTGTFDHVVVNTPSSGSPGISITNTIGTLNLGDASVSNSGTAGIVLNNAGTVNILSGVVNGTAGDGIDSTNTALSASNVLMLNIGGVGINVVNSDATARVVSLISNHITSASDAIKTTDNGTAGNLSLVLNNNTLATTGAGSLAMRIVGSGANSTTINSFNGNTVTGNGVGGGLLFGRVTFDAVTGGAIQQVAGGFTNIGQGTSPAQRVQGDGIHFDAPTGDLSFFQLNVFNNGGTGVFVDTKTLGTTFAMAGGGAVDTTNGAALSLDPLTANLSFSSVSSTNSATYGVNLDTVSGTVGLGTVNVTNAGAAGIRVVNSSAAVAASSITVTGAVTGLQFGNNTGGSFAVTGATSLTGITGTGIDANGAIGTYNLQGNTTINFTGGGRGIDLRNSNVSFTTGNLSITGNGTAGSIGLDLSGSLNPNGANSATPNIVLAHGAGQTAAISNVATGVKLGEPGNSAGANLQYGNLTPISSGGSGSTIAVIAGGKTIDTTNLTSSNSLTQGHYDFTGVTFTGNASFEASANFFFVANAATGTGDGSSVNNRANATTLLTQLGANALANRTVVLINDGTAITIANTAALDANTNITGFGNGNSVAAFTIPVNVVIDAFTGTVTDPTGNGAATLTTAAGHNLISLNGGNSITNVTLSGGDFLISGTGTTTGLTVQGTTLTSGASGVFSFTNASGVINITNNAISGGGRLLDVNGGTAGISLTAGTGSIANTAGSGIQIRNTTGGSVILTGLNVTGATSTPLTFDNNKAGFNITNSTFGVAANTTLLSVDAVTGGSTTPLVFGASDTLTQSSGTIAVIGAGARDIDLSAQNFTNSGTTAANVINVTGQTGGTISFGNVGITGYNNAAGTAVNLQGTGGRVGFVDLDVATTAGAGVNVGAITFAPGSSSTISTNGGTALTMSGTTLSGGAAVFASVSTANAGAGNAGISLANTVGTTIFTTVAISGANATGILLNKAGTVNIQGGTINGSSGSGIDSTNTKLTATGLTIGGTSAPAGNGVRVVNNDGIARVVTISNDNIKSVSDAIKTTDGGTAGELSLALDGNTLQTTAVGSLAMNIAGSALNSTTVNSFNGVTVTGNGTGGGIFFNRVTFDAVTGGAIQQVAGGTANIGQGAGARVAGNGLEFQGPTGDLAFGTLNIFNNAGTGLLVNTKTLATTFSNLSNTTGVINTTGGAAMNLDPLTVNLTFSSVTSANSPTSGVIINTVGGSLALGNVTVTNATAAGISMVASSAAVTAGTVTVTGAGTGLQFGTNTGSFTATGATSLTGITGTGINANAATGTYSFQGLTINYTGAGRGIDLRNSNVSLTTGTLAITGNGTAGSIALDLSGTQNPNGVNSTTPNILLATGAGQTAAISNVATGVKLGDAVNGSAGAYLKYGNQTPTGSGGSGSSIAVISGGITIDTTNLTSTSGFVQGRYEFTGATFTGAASFQASSNFFFVASGATGTGDGSSVNNRANAATLLTQLGANALANRTVVLINDGTAITLANTAALDANTNITGFGNGNSVVAFTVPVNVIVDAFTGTVTDPTGNGAATLTTAAGHNLISLNGGNSITNVSLSGGDFLISGTSTTTGLTVQGNTLTSGASGVFSFTNATGVINLTNNTISGGGRLLDVNGGSAGITLSAGTGSIANTGGSGIQVRNTTGGSVTLTGLNVTGATSTPLTFDNNKATFNITSSTFGVTAGTTLLNVDTVTGGSTTALTFGATDTLTQTSGTIANIGAGARNIDLSAINFTNTGTTAANVINVTGQTGGTISFGNVGITGYNNAAGTAVNLQGTAGTVTFGDLDVATTAGAALNVGAITFNPGSSSTISSTGASAVTMNGTTAQGGAISFTSVTSTGGATGISLTNTLGGITFTGITIGTKTGNGVTLSNAANVTITGGSINGIGGNAIDATNSNLTVGASQLQIGNTGNITGAGINYNVTDGNAHSLTVGNADIRNVGGMGINVAHSGSGTVTVGVTSTAIASTGTALNVVKGGAGALNFSTITDSFSSTGGLGMNANGTAGGGVLTVTQVGADVTSAASGGMVFNGVVFDADPTTAGIQTVSSLGSEITTNGAGLAISNATGTLVLDTLTIANSGGTGLIVTSAVNLSTNHGSITTTNGAAMDLTNATLGLVFDTAVLAVSSTNSTTNGVFIGAGTSGSVNLGGVSVTGATLAGIQVAGSSANVTTGDITVQNSATGLRFGSNTGTFTATGATSLTGITGTGINANAATGTYSFQGNTTIGFTGAGRGIDLRSSNLASFQTGNLSITGNSTAGSIAIDLSGSLYPSGQPVTTNAPNIKLATGVGQTAAISAVATGVRLGDGVLGSAGAYLRYGNQTPTNSGSSIAVIAGGTTVDTGNLTSTTPFQQGRYEFTGVIFTGQATFESSSSNFLFVGTNAAGAANGSNPNNRISTATFLASDNTAVFLAGKTIIFVNDDNVNGINLGAATLNLGASTTIAGFGNGASIVVPGGVQPVNVIGDTFVPGGGTFSDAAGAATIHNNAGVNTITLNTGNTLSNFNLGNGGTSIVGTTFGTLTVNGVSINNTTGGAINLTTGTLAGTGFGSVTSSAGTNGISLTGVTGTMSFGTGALSGASGATFNVSGGNATLTYSGTIANSTSRTVSVQSVTGGSITLSGAINDTGTGILVQNNTGGTINFTGAGSTLNTGANQAVTLATNTGAAINFSGSNLAITTTSGIGFGASGGGTVGLTGVGSTISTGSGTALSLNGVAIGGSGFILKSVSANGAVNGIALNNLTGGGGAGVQVLGTGATNGSGGTIQNTTGAAVSLTNLGSLSGGVTLDNMNLTSDAGGITGTTFGTLAVANVSVTATGTVGALSLTTGAITAGSTFSTLSSSGAATNGVLLNAVTGSFSAAGGSISGATGAAWSVVGGTVSSTYSGNISQANNAALVSVSGGHNTGTLTFDTGTLSATNGTGLVFDNADGTYNFNGTTTLNGGNAAITIQNGSAGTFAFSSNTSVTNPTGTAFTANGSTANVTYSGNLTKNGTSAGLLVDITNESAGTITFQTGTLSSTSSVGTGINLTNVGATVNFNGTTTLNGGNSHIDINGGSTGAITFGTGTTVTSASGADFVFNGSSSNVTYSGGMTQANNALLVSVTNQSGGTILFQTGTLGATNGGGINLNNADGTVSFTGTTTLGGGSAHVDINTGSSGTFTFGSNASITSPAATAFNVNGSSANVTYSGSITQAAAGQAMVNITNETAGTITFQTGTLSATNGTGIVLNNADGTVNFNGTTTLNGGNAHVDINTGSSGTFAFGTGTSITSPTGTAFVFNSSTAGVTYSGNITQATASQLMVDITGQASGTITFQTGTLSATNGTGINLSNVDGTVNFGSFGGTTTLNGGNAHIDINTGSSGTINFAASTSVGAVTAPSGVAFREDTSTANVTYNGTLRQTNAASAVSINAKTGGTTAFTGTITASTSTANAISLTGNTNGTINFTGGNLAITTTTGKGFTATGGGTITVQGASNTISSVGGIALDIENTTIAATGVTFQSISANGGSAGIFLDTTGALGGLTVTGTIGSTTRDNSGGTIQNMAGADGSTAGHGIYLNSTSNVSLNHMNVHNNQGDGIHGNSVAGFTLKYTNMTTNGSSTAQLGNFHGEGDVNFVNLTGSAQVDHNDFQLAFYNTFGVFNSAVTLNRIVMENNTFGANDTVGGNAGVAFQAQGGTMNITFGSGAGTGNTITGAGSNTFILDMHGTASVDLIMKNNAISNNHPNIVTGGGGVSLQSGGVGDQVTFTFNVDSNTFSGSHGAGFFIGTGVLHNGDNFSGTFNNNTIGIQGTANSGSTTGNDLFIQNRGSTTTINVTNNKLYQYNPNGTGAMQLEVGDDGGHVAKATFVVTGNTISNPGTNAALQTYNGIQLNSGPTSTDTSKTNLTLYGNSVTGSGNASQGSTDIRLRQRGLTDVALLGNGSNYSGAVNDTVAVSAFASAQNGGASASAVVTNSPPHGFVGTAFPLIFVPGGQAAAGGGNAVLTQTQLNALGNAAVTLWTATGLNSQQISLLNGITFGIGNLPAGYVGEALPGTILLSADAAGQSWFIDTTPLDNSEFTGTGTRLTAGTGSIAAGRIDAFTVVLHEVGHELGLDDTYLMSNSNSLMYGYITLGERRLPAVNQALGVTAPTGSFADALMLGTSSQVPVSSGSWKPSITIHPPVGPSTLRSKDSHSIDLPAQSNRGGVNWFIPVFGDPRTIYLSPEILPPTHATLEVEQVPGGSGSDQGAVHSTPLSSTDVSEEQKPNEPATLGETFHADFTAGKVPLAKRVP